MHHRAKSCHLIPRQSNRSWLFRTIRSDQRRRKVTCSAIRFQDSSNSVKGSPTVPVVACDEDFRNQSSRAQNHEMRCRDVAAFDDTCRECANRSDCRRTYRFHSSLDPEHHPADRGLRCCRRTCSISGCRDIEERSYIAETFAVDTLTVEELDAVDAFLWKHKCPTFDPSARFLLWKITPSGVWAAAIVMSFVLLLSVLLECAT